MEFKELKNKTVKDLHKLLAELRDKLRDLRFKDANKQLKNVREIRVVKKTVSQILTLLNKKENNTVKEKEEAGASDNK